MRDGADTGDGKRDGGPGDGGSGGLRVRDLQDQGSADYPGADAVVQLSGVVATSQTFWLSAAEDAFFVADVGGGPYSGILVSIDKGEVQVVVGERLDLEGKLVEVQGESGNAGTETRLEASRVTSKGSLEGEVPVTTVTASAFGSAAGIEPYEGVLVRIEDVAVEPFPDGSIFSYGQFQLEGGGLVDDQIFQYIPGNHEVFNAITGGLRYTEGGDYAILPRSADDIDSREGARQIRDATPAQVQGSTYPTDPNAVEVCSTHYQRCNPVRLSQMVVVTRTRGESRDSSCLPEERDDMGRCPYYIYSFFVADPADVDQAGRLHAYAGVKVSFIPGTRWVRGPECDALTGTALATCGQAGNIAASFDTNYGFAGHFQPTAASQTRTHGFPDVGDIVTLVGEPNEYYDNTQIGYLTQLTKLGSTDDTEPLVTMPLPALFDGDVSRIVSGAPRVPEVGDPLVREAVQPGADTEKYEGVLIELANVRTLDPCVPYPNANDPEDMRDFGYFRVAGASSSATGLAGVEVTDYSFGGYFPGTDAGGPPADQRTCEGRDRKCGDNRIEGQTFASIVGVLDYAYSVHRLTTRESEDVQCATECGPAFEQPLYCGGEGQLIEASVAQVRNPDHPDHGAVCDAESCVAVRLPELVVISPTFAIDEENSCLDVEKDGTYCPTYLYAFYAADPRAVDGQGRLQPWSGIKVAFNPGQRWVRGPECQSLTGQALLECGHAGSVDSDLDTAGTYDFAGHFRRSAASQTIDHGFPQAGDVVTLAGLPYDYYDMTQLGYVTELIKLGRTDDAVPAATMPQPALFDGDVSDIVSGMPRVPISGMPEVRPALEPGPLAEAYEGVWIELRNVRTISACVPYAYRNDPNDMRDFGYFRVGGGTAETPLDGVEIGTAYGHNWGGWWRAPTSGGPAYTERTCDNQAGKCDDFRIKDQTFSSLMGVLDYSYEVHRLEPFELADLMCSGSCDGNENPAYCE